MLKLSKKTEYALMAVKYIALNNDCNCTTVKQISEGYNIPFDLLAKVLQKLVRSNIVVSYQGNKGGYTLTKQPAEISLYDIIKAIEPAFGITDCIKENGSEKDCGRFNCCMIRNPLTKVQNEIDSLFKRTTISQIL